MSPKKIAYGEFKGFQWLSVIKPSGRHMYAITCKSLYILFAAFLVKTEPFPVDCMIFFMAEVENLITLDGKRKTPIRDFLNQFSLWKKKKNIFIFVILILRSISISSSSLNCFTTQGQHTGGRTTLCQLQDSITFLTL